MVLEDGGWFSRGVVRVKRRSCERQFEARNLIRDSFSVVGGR